MIKKYSTEIVLVVLTMFILEGLFQTIIGNYSTGWQFYLGIVLVVLFWGLYFFKKNILKRILGMGLVLGFFNIIEFTYYHFIFGFSWSPPGQIFTSVGIQPFIFILFLFFLFTNSKKVISLLASLSTKSSEENEADQNFLIQKYRKKLRGEPLEKLKTIVDHPNDYQKEYILAAQELIDIKVVDSE